MRMPDGAGRSAAGHLVPIDRCYELVGALRLTWRGFDGGQEARRAAGRVLRRPGRAQPARPRGRADARAVFTVVDVVAGAVGGGTRTCWRGVRVEETSGERVHALALRAQVRIEPQRRRYDDTEEQALLDLFGDRSRFARR